MKPRSILLAACEIKLPYQRNLAIGFGISSFIPIIAATVIVAFFQPAPIITSPTQIDKPPLPIPISYQPPVDRFDVPNREHHGSKITNSVPIPVPDETAPIETDMPDQKTLAQFAPDTPISELGSGIIIDTEKVLESAFPPSDVFIPVDEQPVQVTMIQPTYPELARKAGIERKVFVKVLIDKDGTVRRVEVQNPETNDIGFESAAIEAAMQSTWRPAINNGQPVAVWVAYVVAFKLK